MALLDFLMSNAEAAPQSQGQSSLPAVVGGSSLPNVVDISMIDRQSRPYSGSASLDASKGKSYVSAGDFAFGATLKEDADHARAIAKLQSYQDTAQRDRLQNIDRLQSFQKAMADNTINQGISAAIDLKPAAALVDAWTGSHLAASTPAPLNLNERINAIQALQSKVDAEKEQGTKEAMALEQYKIKIKQDRDENNAKNLLALQALGEQNFSVQEASGRKSASKILNAKEITKFSDSSTAREGIIDFMGFIKENPDLMGVLAKVKSKNPFQSFTPEEANMLGKWKEIRQTLGKTLEGGVLRDADWAKYADIIGDINNNPQVAITRLKALKYELERKYINDYNSFTGSRYDTSAFGDKARKIKIDADERAANQGGSDSMLTVKQNMAAPVSSSSSAPAAPNTATLKGLRDSLRGMGQ